jgi:hypothetical protein
LDEDAERYCSVSFSFGSTLLELLGLFEAVNTFDGPKIGAVAGELLAFVGLQTADEVPSYFLGEEFGFLEELLHVVFTEVKVGGRWAM